VLESWGRMHGLESWGRMSVHVGFADSCMSAIYRAVLGVCTYVGTL
jgi:hypothetical protein